MTIFIGSDIAGQCLKDVVKISLKENNHGVVDVTEGKELDSINSTLVVVHEIQKNDDNLEIVVDACGVGSFIVATKVEGVITVEVSDERSVYIVRSHNNVRMITVGAEIVGDTSAKDIAKEFINGYHDGGRHQIRVDMLSKMC